MEDIAAFYFTSLGDSYAGRTGRPDNVGVIGVALYQRKRVEPPPATYAPEPWRERHDGAANESKKSLGAAAPASPAPAEADSNMRDQAQPRAKAESPLGTGHGRREHAPTRYVDFQRRTSEPVETIAIYYDSYRNLVAQGVISSYSSRFSRESSSGCEGISGGGAAGTMPRFLWKSATPITPTLSGRPVRAAYESPSEVK